MATQAQILANRRNAQKSTGPTTLHGKATASKNSIKHGLLARQPVIDSEDQAEFDQYRDQILTELAPATTMESTLAERIVTLAWRLKRTGRIQNQTIDAMKADMTAGPLAKLNRMLMPKNPDESTPAPDLTLGRLALKDFANARVLDRLLMYERRMEHSLYKTMFELQRLCLIRKLLPSDAPDEQTELQLLLGR